MDNHFILTEDILWDYADGLLDADTKALVEKYLAQKPTDRARLAAIMGEKQALAEMPLAKPAANFADKVMAAWTFEQQKARIAAAPKNDWGIWAIAIGFGLLMAAPLLLALFWGGGATDSPINLPQFEVPMAVQKFDLLGALGSPVSQYAFYLALASLSIRLLEKYLHYRRFLHNSSATDAA